MALPFPSPATDAQGCEQGGIPQVFGEWLFCPLIGLSVQLQSTFPLSDSKRVQVLLQMQALTKETLIFQILFLDHPKKMIRDTQRYKPFKQEVRVRGTGGS